MMPRSFHHHHAWTRIARTWLWMRVIGRDLSRSPTEDPAAGRRRSDEEAVIPGFLHARKPIQSWSAFGADS